MLRMHSLNSSIGAIMGKLIAFPGVKLDSEIQRQNEKIDRQEHLKEHITNTALDISIGVFNKFDMAHLPAITFNEGNKRDFVLIHESIKSAIARLYGLKHELQESNAKCIDLAMSDIQFDDNEF
jgi:hypothetical protein